MNFVNSRKLAMILTFVSYNLYLKGYVHQHPKKNSKFFFFINSVIISANYSSFCTHLINFFRINKVRMIY
jgi:hypothetical protein